MFLNNINYLSLSYVILVVIWECIDCGNTEVHSVQ